MHTDTMYTEQKDQVPSPLLKWSAVFGGVVLGLAMLLLLSALWLALAYGSEMEAIRDNLGWYIGISAVASLFVGGMLTGYLSGVRGAGTGMLHGFTLWGLLMLVTITVGVPSLLNVFGLQGLADQADSATRLTNSGSDGTLWVTFWTLLGGFIAAGLGGMIGGAITRAETGVPPVVVRDAVASTPPRTMDRTTTPVRTDAATIDDEIVVDEAPTRL
jgi:hypothetical protein